MICATQCFGATGETRSYIEDVPGVPVNCSAPASAASIRVPGFARDSVEPRAQAAAAVPVLVEVHDTGPRRVSDGSAGTRPPPRLRARGGG
jgi:hypothetical protein